MQQSPGSAQPAPAVPAVPSVAVVVLTGGASSRMGSHKPALEVGGRAIVARVVAAAAAYPVVVVGRPDGVPDGVRVVADRHPGSGPVAGLADGLAALAALTALDADAEARTPDRLDVLVVLAGDLPLVTAAHLERLVAALVAEPGADLAVTVDETGRRNWLCAAWRSTALRHRIAAVGDPRDQSMRALVGDAPAVEVPDPEGAATDVDTPEQLSAARARADRRRPGAR